MLKRIALTTILSLTIVGPCYAQASELECNFSSFKPLVLDHSLLNAATKTVEPKYPSVARAAHVAGKVQVKILVDRIGNVVEACASQGHPSLRTAARDAALAWKFKKNFGFSKRSKFKARYIQSFLVFNFRLE